MFHQEEVSASMDEAVLKRLSDIESAAQSVLQQSDARKKELARQMDEKTKAYDQESDQRVAAQVAEIRHEMQQANEKELDKMQRSAEQTSAALETNYRAKKEALADEIVKTILT